MTGLWSKLGSITRLGAIGGALGAVGGALWTFGAGVLSGFLLPEQLLYSAVVWGMLGSFSAGGFAVVLAGVGRRKSLDDLSIAWSALAGGAAGALFPVAMNVAMNGSLIPLYLMGSLLPIMGICGGLGAGVTGFMVAAAKRAHRAELRDSDPFRSLPPRG